MDKLTDEAWKPLREAAPAFAARWRHCTSYPDYDESEVGQNLVEFTLYLEELMEADPDGLAPVLRALEAVYESEPRLEEKLTISLMEHIVSRAEELGLEFRGVAALLPGPQTRAAWERALAYTHPECVWEWERGLLRKAPLAHAAGQFRLANTFALPDRSTFVLQGQVTAGEVRPGMEVRLEITSGMHFSVPVESVEYVRLPGGDEDIGLLVKERGGLTLDDLEGMFGGLARGTLLDIVAPSNGGSSSA